MNGWYGWDDEILSEFLVTCWSRLGSPWIYFLKILFPLTSMRPYFPYQLYFKSNQTSKYFPQRGHGILPHTSCHIVHLRLKWWYWRGSNRVVCIENTEAAKSICGMSVEEFIWFSKSWKVLYRWYRFFNRSGRFRSHESWIECTLKASLLKITS